MNYVHSLAGNISNTLQSRCRIQFNRMLSGHAQPCGWSCFFAKEECYFHHLHHLSPFVQYE